MTPVNLPLDYYEAINLYEALKVVPDTGDWYNQVKWKLEAVMRLTAAYQSPSQISYMSANVPAEQQIDRIKAK